jgi:hypothetical protein
MMEEINASHKEMLAKMEVERKADLKNLQSMMKRMMDMNEAARLEEEEPTSVDMGPEGVNQEIPRVDAAVMPVGGMRKRCRGRNLAAECHQKPKETTQEKCGSRKRLVVARRGMTRCAKVAWQKGNVFRRKLTQGPCGSQKKKKTAINRGSRPAACVSAAQPPTFNGSTLWSVFWRQSKITAEHNQWCYNTLNK